jgi:hypothetical protein
LAVKTTELIVIVSASAMLPEVIVIVPVAFTGPEFKRHRFRDRTDRHALEMLPDVSEGVGDRDVREVAKQFIVERGSDNRRIYSSW